MIERTFDDVVRIIKPATDDHFRLIPCACGSSEVVYAEYTGPGGTLLWRVVCGDCGATVDFQTNIRHDVQVEWNRRNGNGEIDSKIRQRNHLHRKTYPAAWYGKRR